MKGLGKAEIPVYIDVIYIRGVINLRLLLSPTPPFITTGTFTLPSMPEYDISANPLKKGAFNAMDLPLMKPYSKCHIFVNHNNTFQSDIVVSSQSLFQIRSLLLPTPSLIHIGH